MSAESSNKNQQSFATANAGLILFVGLAAIIFLALYFGYEKLLVDSKIFDQYLELCSGLASQLLSFLGVEHQWVVAEAEIRTRLAVEDLGAFIDVNKGSDASTIFAVLVAGIAAWPGGLLKKLPAILLGLAVMFALNIVRIAGMLLVDIHAPLQFGIYSDYILPGGLILAAASYFLFWIKLSGAHPSD